MTTRSVEAMVSAVLASGLFHAPTDRSGPVLLMLSPGRDSMCLLDLAVDQLGPGGVSVLHVDHGLRETSADEAARVLAIAEARGVAGAVRHAVGAPGSSRHSGDPVGAEGSPRHSSDIADAAACTRGHSGDVVGAEGSPRHSRDIANLHAWARGERARLAEEEALRVGARAVATAHTRSDLIETALFRLATQPGRRALLAMRAREPDAIAPGIDLIRPLLVLGRDETLAWCTARGIGWVDDPSNADARFARSRMRHSVTPVLRSLNPRYEEAVVRTLVELEEERAALDALVATVLPAGRHEVTVDALAALPRAVARLVLRELCERATGRHVARATGRIDELLTRAAADRSPFQLDVGDGARLSVRGGVVRCTRSEGPAAPR